MNRLTEAIERRCGRGEVGAAVRLVVRAGDELARRFKELVLQGAIDASVCRELGERRGGGGRHVLSPWTCPRCGPRLV